MQGPCFNTVWNEPESPKGGSSSGILVESTNTNLKTQGRVPNKQYVWRAVCGGSITKDLESTLSFCFYLSHTFISTALKSHFEDTLMYSSDSKREVIVSSSKTIHCSLAETAVLRIWNLLWKTHFGQWHLHLRKLRSTAFPFTGIWLKCVKTNHLGHLALLAFSMAYTWRWRQTPWLSNLSSTSLVRWLETLSFLWGERSRSSTSIWVKSFWFIFAFSSRKIHENIFNS